MFLLHPTETFSLRIVSLFKDMNFVGLYLFSATWYVIGHELKYKISCGIIAENNETASRREKLFSNPVPFFALYQPLEMGFYKINTRGTSL